MTLIFGLDTGGNLTTSSQLNDLDLAVISPYTALDRQLVGFEYNAGNKKAQILLINISEVGQTRHVADKGGDYLVIDPSEVTPYTNDGRTVSVGFVYRSLDRTELSFGKNITGRDESDFPIYGASATSNRTIPLEQDRYDSLINATTFFGDIIKVLPSDFQLNGVAGGNIIYNDTTGSQGVSVTNDAEELYAFIEIPKGKKATHVKLYGNTNKTYKIYEGNYEDGILGSSIGSGALGVEADITDLPATQSNFMVIKVLTNSQNNVVYGGYIKISNI